MKKILVTGANGQLGSELKKLSNGKPFDFVFTDVNELDITNERSCTAFFDEVEPHFVINCAAYTAVDKAEECQTIAWKVNVEAVRNLVVASSRCRASLVHISTDYVFDGKASTPYVESHPVDPQSEYGRTKAAAEIEALKYDRSIVIRTSWLYSTFGNNFVKTMRRLGAERESIGVVFDQIGTPTYAEDLAAAILQIIAATDENEKAFVPGIFHYSNEGVCSWYDFACAVMRLSGLNCKVRPIETADYPTPAQRPQFGVLNKAKIKSVYGINIPHWYSSLETMINLLRLLESEKSETCLPK
jgi:dTDP-4-dehydrorhamnose reductase